MNSWYEWRKSNVIALFYLFHLKPTTRTVTAAFTRIADISSTIVSILSNEKLYEGTTGPLAEELSILDQDGNLEHVKEIRDVEGEMKKK